MPKIIGENVKKKMSEMGITQMELSLRMGIDQGHLNKLLNNKANWSEKWIMRASKSLKTMP
jgi:plasmid maintenance system antidote protein VapI